LLKEGTDLKYGARHLKRAVERHVVYPLAILLATEQVRLGDVISIDWDGVEAGLKFLKEGEGAAVPSALPSRKTMSKVLAASCGAPGIVSPQTASVQSIGWPSFPDAARNKPTG
jgi:C-terminal, D2-small domain, of ClpB protein